MNPKKPNDNYAFLFLFLAIVIWVVITGYLAYRAVTENRQKRLEKAILLDKMQWYEDSIRWHIQDSSMPAFVAPVTKPTAMPSLKFSPKKEKDSVVMFFDGEFIDEPTTPFLRIDSVNN